MPMKMIESQPPCSRTNPPPQTFGEHLRKLDRRQSWLSSTTVLVLILLSIAVASFAFPNILSRDQGAYPFSLNQAVRSLVGLVLIFSVYLVYQQSMISRIRNQLRSQIESLAKVQTLTDEAYKLAALDQLTGLYNRRSGEQRLDDLGDGVPDGICMDTEGAVWVRGRSEQALRARSRRW